MELTFLAAKHVDGIKVTAPVVVIESFLKALESVFGKGEIDVTWNNFTCCGLAHKRLDDCSYTVDQISHIAAMKPISNKGTLGKSATEV